MSWLAQLSPSADPASVQQLLDGYYRLLDLVKAERSQMQQHAAPLADRIAMAGVQQDIEAGIAAARRWLSRVARRGGVEPIYV